MYPTCRNLPVEAPPARFVCTANLRKMHAVTSHARVHTEEIELPWTINLAPSLPPDPGLRASIRLALQRATALDKPLVAGPTLYQDRPNTSIAETQDELLVQ